MTQLIALYSHAPQSGKTTIANYLGYQHGYKTIKFAGALKSMVYTLLTNFKDDPEWAYACIEGDQKEVPLKFLGGATPRFMMQTLGTAWGRNSIDQNIWVTAAFSKIRRAMLDGQAVVVDDMRFPNEYKVLETLGAKFVYVKRTGSDVWVGEDTEGLLSDHAWDFTIEANDGEVKHLFDGMDYLIQGEVTPS